MHTITSSRSPYGTCSFNGRLTKCKRLRTGSISRGGRSFLWHGGGSLFLDWNPKLLWLLSERNHQGSTPWPRNQRSLMAKAAQSKELRAAFVQHERETKGQVKRLDRVFKIIGKPARGKTCPAINGITEEGSEIMKDFKGMPALDAGLLASAQAVEHHEISRYGTLSTWAEELGYDEAVQLLDATLQEERTRTRPSPE